MKLDILAFAAHPDDIELSCGATLAKHVALNDKVGVIDFTKGELGTRGTPEIRMKEATESAAILGLAMRENLSFADGFFADDHEHQIKIVRKLRAYQPNIVLANAIKDRHPDHARASEMVKTSVFLSGLKKIETYDESGNLQEPWRPKILLHYIQSIPIAPDFVVDVSEHWETKMKAVRAFASQFHNPKSDEPDTYISDPKFLKMIEARGLEFGQILNVDYAEGFTIDRYLGVKDLKSLL